MCCFTCKAHHMQQQEKQQGCGWCAYAASCSAMQEGARGASCDAGYHHPHSQRKAAGMRATKARVD